MLETGKEHSNRFSGDFRSTNFFSGWGVDVSHLPHEDSHAADNGSVREKAGCTRFYRLKSTRTKARNYGSKLCYLCYFQGHKAQEFYHFRISRASCLKKLTFSVMSVDWKCRSSVISKSSSKDIFSINYLMAAMSGLPCPLQDLVICRTRALMPDSEVRSVGSIHVQHLAPTRLLLVFLRKSIWDTWIT